MKLKMYEYLSTYYELLYTNPVEVAKEKFEELFQTEKPKTLTKKQSN